MAKKSSVFVCQQCGYKSPGQLGRCPNCGSWNSFVEEISEAPKTKALREGGSSRLVRLSGVEAGVLTRQSTGLAELDMVLGGGVVGGMVVLLSGEPGVGKSTLLLEVARAWRGEVLYVAGEESAGQIKLRAERLGAQLPNLSVLETNDVDRVVGQIQADKNIRLVIIDSIQTLATTELAGMAGTVGQVRESAARVIGVVKQLGIPTFIVGHVTKEGSIAGPKVLEHAVDTIISIEGERFTSLRIIRSTKNRFGPTDEVGVLEMSDGGLREVADLQSLFTDNKSQGQPGACMTITMEGMRPLLVEVQALVTQTPLPAPRRVATGISNSRLQTIVAIIQKRLSAPLYKEDIYVSVAGGLTITEPAADLPIALAIISSFKDRPVPPKTLAIGELDLLGTVRKVNSLPRRVKEAKKLGFKNILTSETLSSLSDISI